MPQTAKTSVPGTHWPAIPTRAGARMLALQFQLEQSQWWTPEALQTRQFQQLSLLLKHARQTVPFYRDTLPAAGPRRPVCHADWLRIPLLKRQDILHQKQALISTQIPKAHGSLSETSSSGSTGRPVVKLRTQLELFYSHAITLREHLWHRRDFSGKLTGIRSIKGLAAGKPATWSGWGVATDEAFVMGPSSALDICTDIKTQAAWLAQENPHYLLSYPTNLRELIRHLPEPPSNLRELRSFGESVPDGLRETVREAWGVKLVDMYSAQEVGYMGLQCPDHEHYHTQPEHVFVEILREDGTPCLPGEVGRVVVTNLHGFAMPLIRYDILDYAELGEACSCGRNSPVLKRVLGRTRSLITMPNGARYMPKTTGATIEACKIAPIEQIQVIQHSLEDVEVKLAVGRALLPDEERQLIRLFQDALEHPFNIQLNRVEHIPRTAGGKFEDFLSHVVPQSSEP